MAENSLQHPPRDSLEKDKKMNYPLLVSTGAIAVGMVVMERWCSWRLNVGRRRRRTLPETSPERPADHGTFTNAS